MKNNPFVSFLLLVAIQIMLFVYLYYVDFDFRIDEDLVLAFFCFFIPVICIILNFFTKNSPLKKFFRYFTIFLVLVSILSFGAMWYLSALGRAYQH